MQLYTYMKHHATVQRARERYITSRKNPSQFLEDFFTTAVVPFTLVLVRGVALHIYIFKNQIMIVLFKTSANTGRGQIGQSLGTQMTNINFAHMFSMVKINSKNNSENRFFL